ncbi:hypothetical protein ASPCAL11769 [Aspergillus calidoustus]|uniref:Uncharacterized protein n=1 Tax=Aspergillus calidoustus TaxID=454130 RepID=A0A0U5GC73_ASPCI|nr:hypothetical protein ASPCAL11769 [Aspergillus calidoustus]
MSGRADLCAFRIGIEEGMSPNWVANRAANVDDSAHKLVPAHAMGANQAIESSDRQSSEDSLCRKRAKPVRKRCVSSNGKGEGERERASQGRATGGQPITR